MKQNFNTPYDDVFRTLLNDCPSLIIPIINEIFDEEYTGGEEIELSQNELFFQEPEGTEGERITDSSFVIITENKRRKRYHLECQSTPDGSMVIRMFEYDVLVAIRNGELSKEGIVVRFPKSAVLYLRHTRTTPDKLTVRIETPEGNVSYSVPILKVKRYTIEEIFEKNLLFLIPFYIFSYEKDFRKIENEKERLQALKEEYNKIRKHLDTLSEKGKLNEYTKRTIVRMTGIVVKSLARRYEKIQRGVTDVMGGKILEYEEKDILNRGKMQGIALGREEGRFVGLEEKTRMIVLNMLKRNMSDADICALAECSQELVDEVRKSIQ